jgi:tetratricopeptide (TPR) repeat protein
MAGISRDWQAVSPYLDEVLALPEGERGAWLAKLDEQNHGLAELVRTLLNEYQLLAQEGFLEGASLPLPVGLPVPGNAVGPYRLVSLIGQGGMGSVWLAERSDGEVRQKAAIKLLRADADRPSFRERFLNERQILANLSHPSIARLLDAGHTSDGRPYLVMEYIEGIPIDAYAARLPVRERLALFLSVCAGVSHAHGRLIIHRDLKPSNILVEGAGQPKILDFGIAKLLDAELESTQTIERILTPGYASPEQFHGIAQTTATDIYSLGAVLYKLLTGRLPREGGDAAAPGAPVPPTRTNAELPADIDFILGKALRGEPDERYASVDAFANDLRAVLEFRPVAARSGDRWYRARRFLRRNWIPVAAAAATLTGLGAGLFVANHERAIAQRRFQEVRQLSNKLFDIDEIASQMPGSTGIRQKIADTSLEYLRRLSADARSDPALALELANAYVRLARVQGVGSGRNLGQVEQAGQSLRAAGELIQTVVAAQPRNRAAMIRAAVVANDRTTLASLQRGRRDNARGGEALAFAREAAGWLEKFRPAKGDTPADLEDAFDIYMGVADQYKQARRFEDALEMVRRGSDLARAAGNRDFLAMFLWVSAEASQQRGDLDGALAVIREAVQIQESLFTNTDVRQTMRLAHVLIWEGRILGQHNGLSLGRSEEAVVPLASAFRITDEVVHQEAKDWSVRGRLAMAGHAMADILRHSDAARALEIYDHTLRHLAEVQDNTVLRRFEVEAMVGSTYALRGLGRPAEARQRLDAAFDRLSRLKLYPAEKVTSGSVTFKALRALADLEEEKGNTPRAIEIHTRLLEQIAAAGSDPGNSLEDAVDFGNLHGAIADLHRRSGHTDLAAAFSARHVELWQQWDRKLPGNAFVARQLASARSHQ